MQLALDGLYPHDTFNLITFAGDTQILFDQPVPATKENLRKAQAFLSSRSGGGGTEMMKAIRAALDPSDAQNHIRIVCFMTDGYVGNDLEIISKFRSIRTRECSHSASELSQSLPARQDGRRGPRRS
jgi:Ca-activated chloride channel family protein